jgi:hypothetical protein
MITVPPGPGRRWNILTEVGKLSIPENGNIHNGIIKN